ncbi:MAG: 50S ribosomal protein L18 [Alphaproteobacteria bacterium CG11_big_fil_rev_8_21_14_0_20_39_49]|nr:MAG: 50S ribosomal protein L18 [Alphaproteobacteria bacterium CG11_big_fil_rev_8_21_14_0_20_39_49]
MVMAINARRKRSVRFNLRKNNKGGRVRLVVFRSNQHIYAQLIDDKQGTTLGQSSTLDKDVAQGLKSKSNIEAASKVGAAIAKKAKDAKVEEVVFDRSGYLYHGRVKALAEAARVGGLKF